MSPGYPGGYTSYAPGPMPYASPGLAPAYAYGPPPPMGGYAVGNPGYGAGYGAEPLYSTAGSMFPSPNPCSNTRRGCTRNVHSSTVKYAIRIRLCHPHLLVG